MLLYALEEFQRRDAAITIAAVEGSPLWKRLPDGPHKLALPNNEQFSIRGLLNQLRAMRGLGKPEIVHGWTARDWELVSLFAATHRAIAIGSLHDHPRAEFISPKRQRLMRAMNQIGLKRTICVSDAVRKACHNAGYTEGKLTVIRNGLPDSEEWNRPPRQEDATPLRMGFLGVISKRKGVLSLFEALDPIASKPQAPSFELHIAGEAQDEEGRKILETIRSRYDRRPWWTRVRWIGWTSNPREFLKGLDLLVAPSISFDPFPTVLLESGFAGVPALACRVGGVEEIVRHNETGWTYDAGDQEEFTERLNAALHDRRQLASMGQRAAIHLRAKFTVGEMVDRYLELYQSIGAR